MAENKQKYTLPSIPDGNAPEMPQLTRIVVVTLSWALSWQKANLDFISTHLLVGFSLFMFHFLQFYLSIRAKTEAQSTQKFQSKLCIYFPRHDALHFTRMIKLELLIT